MVDGAASLMTMFYGLRAAGMWKEERGTNILDGGAPFYRTYATQDNRYIVVCAIEKKFFRALLEGLSVNDIDPDDQFDQDKWPEQAARFQAVFETKTRDEWSDLLEGSDACIAPVLSMSEAPGHPHYRARDTFQEVDGVVQPGPAPRFSRTQSEIACPPADANNVALTEWGMSPAEIERLQKAGVLAS
jgi:alpha-methylacyl-CoA racemase